MKSDLLTQRKMQAFDRVQDREVGVELVGVLEFEELVIEVGRDDRGYFYTDIWDAVSGERFPAGPHNSAVQAFEALNEYLSCGEVI